MRLIKIVLIAFLALAAPARAEIAWVDLAGGYELKAAELFKLRTELPPELNDSLRSIRNKPFEDEAAFRAALAVALLTDELRSLWTDRLVALAVSGGGAFGVEPREGELLTLYVAGADHALDAHPFTSQSWIELPPVTEASGFTTTLEGECLAVGRNAPLFRLCSPQIADGEKSVLLEMDAKHIVGLGQEFQDGQGTLAERSGHVRNGRNVMSSFNGGANGNTLFPIAYFDQEQPFALILDNRYPQSWDFSSEPARLEVKGGDLRLHVLTGASLADIRRRYMALTGHPPVPPKSMFGLWISEYGYENWDELDGRIASLKRAGFPLSGAVLDLFWFGGIRPNSPLSAMGRLDWDRERFPDPEGKIAAHAQDGLSLMLIEESYIASGLTEHQRLAEIGGLAHDEAGRPLPTSASGDWWGRGGMIDWLATEAAAEWHDWKRQPLIEMGIAGHWIDLGEPEMVAPGFRYGPDNLSDAEVRNSYNVLWAQSIADGYARNAPERRPFIMSRSGGMGMQSLGAAMWSGDTGGDFASLAAQMAQQQHMMWSGLDYYGSDVGGFHRGALGAYSGEREALLDELYTQWFAYAAMFEVPVRPHTENLCNCRETAPDRIGDVASNLANIELRYRLTPYYYALAHRAWLTGEPVFPSLDYYFDDPVVKGLGAIKMIGSELLSAAVAEPGAEEVSVYLPAGDWYDVRSGEVISSAGETVTRPLYRDGRLELPLLARDGAIVPMTDGLHVFGSASSRFDWYDDDGISTAYLRGAYEHIAVVVDGNTLRVSRQRGETLTPERIAWTRRTPVEKVLVDGVEVPFVVDGSSVSVQINTLNGEMIVEVE